MRIPVKAKGHHPWKACSCRLCYQNSGWYIIWFCNLHQIWLLMLLRKTKRYSGNVWLKQFLNPFKLVTDSILGNDRGGLGRGVVMKNGQGQMGRVWGYRAWGSDGQGVQVRWAGGSGQMGRGFRSVRQGWDGLGGWVPGVGRYLTPPIFHHCPPNPRGPSPLSFSTLSATNLHRFKELF